MNIFVFLIFCERGHFVLESVVSAISDVMGVVTTMIDGILGVPLLVFFVAAGLIPVAIGIFKRMKRAAK